MAITKEDVKEIVKHVEGFKTGNFKGLGKIMNIVEKYDGEEGELLKSYRYELKDGVKEPMEGNSQNALKSNIKWFRELEKKMKKNDDLKDYAETLVDPVVEAINEFLKSH